MKVPDGMAFYSSYHKFIVFYFFADKKAQALQVLEASMPPIDVLYPFADECVIPSPFGEMKAVLTTLDATAVTETALAAIKQRFFWNGLKLHIEALREEAETNYLKLIVTAQEMTE